jgi:hypothetical protein
MNPKVTASYNAPILTTAVCAAAMLMKNEDQKLMEI